MKSSLMRILLLVGLAAALAAGGSLFIARKGPKVHAAARPAPDVRGIDAQGRTPAESQAITDALKALPRAEAGLRTAGDDDAAPSDSRRDLENLYADYHSYFVRGDLNGDGRLDFAQAFVEKGKATAWFHVAVFFGREGDGFEKPVWVERAVSLAAGDLSIERSLLIVTPDVAVDQARRWRWEPEERRFEDADENATNEPSSDGESDEGDDGLPRTRV